MTIADCTSHGALSALWSTLWSTLNGMIFVLITPAVLLLCITTYKFFIHVSAISKSQNRGVDIFEVLENRLARTTLASSWVLTLVNTLAKQATSDENRDAQLMFLSEKEGILSRLRELQQQEIYTIEQGDQPVEEPQASPRFQRIPERRHSPNIQEKLKQIASEASDLWIKYKTVQIRQPSGAWIREDLRRSKREQHHRDENQCRQYRGCCAFECGCCMKPRATNSGRMTSIIPLSASHCTAWCRCCRKREMPALDGEMKKD